MTVLIAYGSKRGGTAGLAQMMGDELRSRGIDAKVVDAGRKVDPTKHEAVIVGGALYASRWHRAARRFVKRNAKALRNLPVWIFSSGPLDATAEESEIPPVDQVVKLMALIDARDHETFGGRLAPDAKGFPASAMAKTKAGDWRDQAHVAHWVDEIAAGIRPAGQD